LHSLGAARKNSVIVIAQQISDEEAHVIDHRTLALAAQELAAARQARKPLRALAEGRMPTTIDEGYAAQAAFRSLWPENIGGWKVGATALPVQALFRVEQPFYGPIFAPTILQSPARPPASDFFHLTIESEFVFHLGRDLPASAEGYSRSEIEAAFATVLPGLEIVGGRFEGLTTAGAPSIIADCAGNEGLVIGKPQTGWREADLITQRVRLEVNGRIVGDGSGADVLGSPVRVLEFLVADMSRRGISMTAGQYISTGTCTGLITIAPGEHAVADFGRLGVVEVCFR
jgi:2-keto-4-pentenoate hydratase